jgi:hypothetical protein
LWTFAGHLFAAHIHQMTLSATGENSPSSSSSYPHQPSSAANYEAAVMTANLTHSQLLKYYMDLRRQMPYADVELPKDGGYFFYNFYNINFVCLNHIKNRKKFYFKEQGIKY